MWTLAFRRAAARVWMSGAGSKATTPEPGGGSGLVAARRLSGPASGQLASQRVHSPQPSPAWTPADLPTDVREALRQLREGLSTMRGELEQVREENSVLRADNKWLRRAIARGISPAFSVVQYNILAGYLGNNTEPWFLYGVDCPPERRASVMRKHGEKKDGKYVNVGWPNYVRGIFSDDEIRRVEEVDASSFAWEGAGGAGGRRDRIVDTIRRLDGDIVCLVECDHFDDISGVRPTASGHDPNPGFFRAALSKMGYGGVWRKRPRGASHDGCAVFWRESVFALVAEEGLDCTDDLGSGRADRTCLVVLLRMLEWEQPLVVVSCHLARNPEEARQDLLRARQLGQVMRFLGKFCQTHGVEDAPVVVTGDLNATTFGRVRGLAEAILVLGAAQQDAMVHPFVFEARDVPTGPTSVTDCRQVRIDTIMHQSQRLGLVDVMKLPALTSPIPDPQHPSDHLPIKATFQVRNDVCQRNLIAGMYVKTILGIDVDTPLNTEQLEDLFLFFDWDGTGQVDRASLRRGLSQIDISLRKSELDEFTQKLLLSSHGSNPASPRSGALKALAPRVPQTSNQGRVYVYGQIGLHEFKEAYVAALRARLPQQEELAWAFSMFDTDGDGELDLEEMKAGFRDSSPFMVSEAHIEEIFHSVDRDRSGKVSWQEFLKYSAKQYGKFVCGSTRCGSQPPTPRARLVTGETAPADHCDALHPVAAKLAA